MAPLQSAVSDDLILIRTFNGFSAETAKGERLPIKNQKAKGLLAYLVLNPGWCETRERLAGLLWSDRSEDNARASLRQCVKQLREAFAAVGADAFQADRQEISLRPESVRTDLDDIKEQLDREEINVALLGGAAAPEHLLYGFETLDQSFSAWLHVVRQNWSNELIDDLRDILRRRAKSSRRAAEALVRLDPTHEEAHRFLIRTLAEEGNVPSALRQYKNLWDLLDQEYDMEPAEETQLLIAEVKTGEFAAPETRELPEQQKNKAVSDSGVTEERLPKIEISAFEASGPGGSKDYLMRGFRQDLIACLVRFREWVVVETQARAEDEAADHSPADYSLEGSYFEGDEEVHLVLTLKDLASQRFIWSERIQIDPVRWFTAQQEIVRRVSVAMNVYLSAERVAQLAKDKHVSQAAYDLWLRGQDLNLQWQPEAENQAEALFRQIISQTPAFAPAYSSLASIYNCRHICFPGVFRDPDLEEQALQYAQRSVQLDPLDTRSQLALAWSNAMRDRFDQAELHYNLAFDLNANNPTTLISCAQGWAFCGNYVSARKAADQAVALNPMMPSYHWAYLVGIRFLCHDYEGSLKAAKLSGDTISNIPGWEVAALAQSGRIEAARSKGRSFLEFIASKWQGSEPSTEENIVRWYLHSFPIKAEEARLRLAEGLYKAGLPMVIWSNPHDNRDRHPAYLHWLST